MPASLSNRTDARPPAATPMQPSHAGARTQHGASVIVVAPDPMSLDAATRNAPTLLSDAAKQLARVKFTSLH